MRCQFQQMIDLTSWEKRLHSVVYPPNSTKRDKEGFLLEVVHRLALNVIFSIIGGKVESQCDNADKWKENRASKCDHKIEGGLQESKNWDTTHYTVNSTLVEDEINSRFKADDSDHKKEWLTVISVVTGFLSSAFRAIKSKIVTLGFKVTPENKERAFLLLVIKLAKGLGVWHIVQGRLIRMHLISGGGIHSEKNNHKLISLSKCLRSQENQKSGKGPPFQPSNPAFQSFISSDAFPSHNPTQLSTVPIATAYPPNKSNSEPPEQAELHESISPNYERGIMWHELTCRKCFEYRTCKLIAKLKELTEKHKRKKEKANQPKVYENPIEVSKMWKVLKEEMTGEIKKIGIKKQKCLNRRRYLAIHSGYRLFKNQQQMRGVQIPVKEGETKDLNTKVYFSIHDKNER